jgi:predicted metalloprotease with PDZ domain
MMNKSRLVAIAIALILSGSFAVGGEKKCTADTQECLDYMVKTFKKRGWVGLELENMRVTRVIPGSPAEAARFKVGDRLVAFNGIEMTPANEKALKEAQKSMRPGKQVTYRVERDGSMRELTVTLAPLREDVMALWIGRHMIEHANVEGAKDKD